MAMSPEEKREFEMLKTLVQSLVRVENVPFIESAKRRISLPGITTETVGNTSGVLKTVSEAGTSTYDVADAFDGTITIEDERGNFYKLGYYNP